jgi:hypothetical protein
MVDTEINTKEAAEEELKKMKKEKILDMIMTQTNYTEEEALEKLKKWNYNTIFVIKDYLNPDFLKKKEEKEKSLNQRMMHEIRNFCDRGQKIYNLKQKMAKKMKELENKLIPQENKLIPQENKKINT